MPSSDLGFSIRPGVVLVDRWPEITGLLSDSDRDTLTLAWPRSVHLRGEPLAVLIVDEGSIVALAAGQLSRQAITNLERRLRLSELVELDRALPIRAIASSVPSHLRNRALTSLTSGGPVSANTWRAIVEALFEADAGLIELLRRPDIEIPRWASEESFAAARIVADERDAVGLALAFAGERPQRHLWAMLPSAPEPVSSVAMYGTIEIEDELIQADVSSFGDLTTLPIAGRGEFRLADGHDLIIYNANRKPAERALGVDLIYYLPVFDSFVLVQMKRMRPRESGNGEAYYPASDSNLESELARMRQLADDSAKCDSAPDARLMPDPCVIKFSKASLRLDKPEMSGGFYLTRQVFDDLRRAGEFKNSRGGETVSYETAWRRLSLTQFVDLVKSGWLGSRSYRSDQVRSLIAGLVDAGYWVVLAEPTHQPTVTAT